MRILADEISEQLVLLLTQLPESSAAWFEKENQTLMDLAMTHPNHVALATAWANLSAQAGRQFRNIDIPVCTPELQAPNWTAVELARLQLMANVLQVLPESERRDFFSQCLRYADDNEKQAIAKGLCLVDPEGNCLDIVLNLCRTNNRDLFSAIAVENAWPAEHFSNTEFEQMLLKCLFLGLNINLVIGIKHRHSQRMSQLAFDYLSELALACREWPPSIYTSINIGHLTTEQIQRLETLPERIKWSLSDSIIAN